MNNSIETVKLDNDKYLTKWYGKYNPGLIVISDTDITKSFYGRELNLF